MVEHLPQKFTERMKNQLGNQWDSFKKSLADTTPVSIRYNPTKNHDKVISEPVPWCEQGVYLKQRPSFTLDPNFHGGAYYVQEASSMLLEQVWKAINPGNKVVKVLDLCASPGGKSTHLLSLMSNDSLLVSNEVIQARVPALMENISKWGFPNIVVTSLDPKFFNRLEGYFDIILVDAPCSGEGLFRKDPKAVLEWSVENASNCSLRQTRILHDILPALKSEGHLIYSTCTYNPEENIKQIELLSENSALECLNLDLNASWGIQKMHSKGAIGFQSFPHLSRGEGFFISTLQNACAQNKDLPVKKKLHAPAKKTFDHSRWLREDEKWYIFESFENEFSFIPEYIKPAIEQIITQMPVKKIGTHFITMKGKDVLPSHQLALSFCKSPDLPGISLDLHNSLEYLRKNPLLIEYPGNGWQLVSHHGNALGWVNATSGRLNNKLPKEFRIRNL